MTPPPRAERLADGTPLLRYGPEHGLPVVLLQPLFEERNACRALVSAIARGLAAAGLACLLPDLPGTGEDGRALETVGWADWQAAADLAIAHAAATSGAPPATVAIRGGALLDGAATRRWRLSPVEGRSLLRDLERAGLTGDPMAGYAPAPPLIDGLAAVRPDREARTLRLDGDPREAERHLPGAALWRRGEPGTDDALAAACVADILAFVGTDARRAAPAPAPVTWEAGRQIGTAALGEGWIAVTLDGPRVATRGWVFVTGGTQTRIGPHRLYERLATRLAAAGEAVARYDRRGVGDSPGRDPGYAAQQEEMAAALAALRDYAPQLATIGGFGLCDGATALALHGRDLGIARMVLANPWVIEAVDAEPPAAAVRAYYADRLRDPAAWARLIRGGVDIRGLVRSLRKGATADDTTLAARVAGGVPPGSTIVLASRDATARAFAGAWSRVTPPPVETIAIDSASHGFAGADAFAALASALTRRR